jgi:hypothetical protein
LSQEFGLGRNPGLSECLQGKRALAKCIYHLEEVGLWILPAGSSHGNALELLESGRLSAVHGSVDRLVRLGPYRFSSNSAFSGYQRLGADWRMESLWSPGKEYAEAALAERPRSVEPKKLIGALLNCSQSASLTATITIARPIHHVTVGGSLQ